MSGATKAVTKEYFLTQEYTPKQLAELIKVQDALYDSIMGDMSQSSLSKILNQSSTALSLISIVGGTATGVASILFGLFGSLSSAEKSTLETLMNKGYRSLNKIETAGILNDATAYEITMPILEYTNEKIRIVAGDCSGRLLINGVWVS